jgi:hypothetical protein
VLQLRGSRQKIDKRRFSVWLDNEDVKQKLLTYSEYKNGEKNVLTKMFECK